MNLTGKDVVIKVSGQGVVAANLPTTTLDNKTYQIADSLKQVIALNTPVTVKNNGVETEEKYKLNRLNGTITFETVDDTREITIDCTYLPLVTVAEAHVASFTDYSFNKNDTSDVVVNFLIGQNQDYFLFRITSYYSLNENSTMLVIRIDAPTNAADTDVFISLLPGLNAYNKAFDVEDIANTVPYLKTDAGGVGSLYDSNFTRNYYNNKIPLYNLYAFTTSQGIRGKISNLIVMPNSYSTTIGSFYSVNGVVYVGLGSLNGKIDSLWNGVLLRCY